MAEIERVTATGPVVIIAILSDPIIATVVDSAQGDERSVQIQLSAVVEHNVEDDLNTRFV